MSQLAKCALDTYLMLYFGTTHSDFNCMFAVQMAFEFARKNLSLGPPSLKSRVKYRFQ